MFRREGGVVVEDMIIEWVYCFWVGVDVDDMIVCSDLRLYFKKPEYLDSDSYKFQGDERPLYIHVPTSPHPLIPPISITPLHSDQQTPWFPIPMYGLLIPSPLPCPRVPTICRCNVSVGIRKMYSHFGYDSTGF